MNTKKNEYYKIISNNIKLLRKNRKMSQEALAERVGCSREFVSRVENCRERVSLSTLLKIAEIFNINPSRLFT